MGFCCIAEMNETSTLLCKNIYSFIVKLRNRCVCASVCVYERETETERQKERERDRLTATINTVSS